VHGGTLMSDLPRPPLRDVPRPDQPGPDPEPPGIRGPRLLERVAAQSSNRGQTHAPAACPLSQAVAHPTACIRARCPYFRVPGTHALCAVEQWSPAARRNPRIARWFIERRDEMTRGRVV
jgi:hypothetical protein